MRNVTVALLDSGINYRDPFFKPYIREGRNLFSNSKDSFMDDNGHGSLCASAIIKENPNVKLYIEKVLDKNNLSNICVLERGLEYLLEEDIQIISMSLTLTSMVRENRLRKLCMELERQGKILICTLANGVSKSYPANYQSVIGVKGFILEDEKSFWFNRKKHIQAVVDNNPYLLRNEQQQYQLFGKCNSFSTAKFSGIVSKIMQKNDIGDKHEIEDILEKNSRRNKWCKKHFIASKRFPEFKPRNDYNYMLVHRIAWLIMEYLHLSGTDVLYEHSLFDSHIGLNYTNAFGLLQKIEQEINIKIIDYTKISRYDFYSVYTLVSLVEKYLGEIR